MRGVLKKAMDIGATPSNVATYVSLQGMRVFGGLFGTLRLRLKALLFGVELGRGVRAHGPVGLMRWPGSAIRIGDGVSLVSSWRRSTAAALSHHVRLRTFSPQARIEIGEGCELSGASISCRSTSVVLGRNVLVAPDAVIVDSDFHAPWPVEARKDDPGWDRDRPVEIGDGAWIGMRCIVLKGARIGAGAIIGAGSVVTGEIPANAVACGSPARVIRRCPPDGGAPEGG